MQTQRFIRPDKRDARPTAGGRALWLLLLVAASVALSLGFACAVPFAAFAAAAALTLDKRLALLLVIAVWLANQLVGYGLLGYPWTTNSLAWGAVLGLVSVAATVAAQMIVQHLDRRSPVLRSIAAFSGAFVIYEAGLFLAAATLLGGTEDFAPSIVFYILEINVAGLAGLLVLNRLGMSIGLTGGPARPTVVTHPV